MRRVRFELPLARPRLSWAVTAAVCVALALAYALTLQTHVAGSFNEQLSPATRLKNEYIKDVSEIQVALNVWGTVHHTGYPLYTVLGNLFTLPLRLIGVEPATAASLYALVWGIVALGTFARLVQRLTGRLALAALSAGVLGLARSIWLHNVVAEVYSMSLAITMLMLAIALWPEPWRGAWGLRRRFLALALLGGIGVAHHRAVAFVAPGLLAAVWLHRRDEPIYWPRTVLAAIGLFLLGFIPYIYLPLREWQGAEWVYGEPGTLRGLWTEFTGREADRLITLPADAAGWGENARRVITILARELTLPGLIAAVAGTLAALSGGRHRTAARLMALAALGPLAFAVAFHSAVLPEAILMPVVAALIFETALALDRLAIVRPAAGRVAAAGLAAWAIALGVVHGSLVRELVREPSGLQTIERLARVPPGERTAIFYPWGPRYAAASYARLATGERRDLLIVDHKADLRALLDDGYTLLTEPETFYTFPPSWDSPYGAGSGWWANQIGALYLQSGPPGFIAIRRTPSLAGADDAAGTRLVDGIAWRDAWLACSADDITLHVIWQARQQPSRSPSVFVHLLADGSPLPLAQADQRAPVYGLRPFTQWSPGEIIHDTYALPRLPGAAAVRFGLYEQNPAGEFTNYEAATLPLDTCRPDQD